MMRSVSLFLINIYQHSFAILLGGACRFEPSCSEYAKLAFQQHGFFCAFKLTLIRLSKCQPWGGFGFDDVPACANCCNQHALPKERCT